MRDLARLDELLQGREGLLQRGAHVGPVQVVEVDAVDPQALQALVAGAHHHLGRESLATAARGAAAHLARDARAAPPAQRAAKDQLRVAVRVRGIEQGHAALEGARHDAVRLLVGRPLAEVHGAADDSDGSARGPRFQPICHARFSTPPAPWRRALRPRTQGRTGTGRRATPGPRGPRRSGVPGASRGCTRRSAARIRPRVSRAAPR